MAGRVGEKGSVDGESYCGFGVFYVGDRERGCYICDTWLTNNKKDEE